MARRKNISEDTQVQERAEVVGLVEPARLHAVVERRAGKTRLGAHFFAPDDGRRAIVLCSHRIPFVRGIRLVPG
jgi:hypothetical protein